MVSRLSGLIAIEYNICSLIRIWWSVICYVYIYVLLLIIFIYICIHIEKTDICMYTNIIYIYIFKRNICMYIDASVHNEPYHQIAMTVQRTGGDVLRWMTNGVALGVIWVHDQIAMTGASCAKGGGRGECSGGG